MRLAIFDFDDTILQGNSWQLFFRAEIRRRPARAPLLCGGYVLRRLRSWSGKRLRQLVLGGLRGLTTDELRDLAQKFHQRHLQPRIRRLATHEIAQRRAAGYEIVIATGAWDFLVRPFAQDVQADALVATTVACADGVCLGDISGDECLGEAKARAVSACFQDRRDIDWKASCVFTDSLLDLPLLRLVGEPWYVGRSLPRRSRSVLGLRTCYWE